MTRIVTKRIPAGKYEGQYREGLDNHQTRGWRSKQNPKQACDTLYCGACETRFRAYKTECPRCGGDT